MIGKLKDSKTLLEKKNDIKRRIEELEKKILENEYPNSYFLSRDLTIRHYLKEMLFDLESKGGTKC